MVQSGCIGSPASGFGLRILDFKSFEVEFRVKDAGCALFAFHVSRFRVYRPSVEFSPCQSVSNSKSGVSNTRRANVETCLTHPDTNGS